MIVLGTIAGHFVGAALLTLQNWYCQSNSCVPLDFDPNSYRALLQGAAAAQRAPDLAIEIWLLQVLLIGVLAAIGAFWLSRWKFVTDRLDPIAFGWLSPAVQAVKNGNSFVTAYVVTKTSHNDLSVAYEGVVQQLALDEDQSIKLVVLNEVDRFLVRITEGGLARVNTSANPITQLQITASEIANVALEVMQAPEQDVTAIEHEGDFASADVADEEGSSADKSPSWLQLVALAFKGGRQ
ncbi:hypothetical protein K3177_05245 [Qipengyuania sp. GH25]|uniref:TPM domain-containing protein n=1 Tax=Qipengyuania pacifica TaxID=2860199 RepID=A0ABS7JE38_9SPHN|nr:hypothetical protein [Qipengyuania aerophila]MBX7487913.1 hypothetical protein [Qipengyuania aerophila]